MILTVRNCEMNKEMYDFQRKKERKKEADDKQIIER